MLSSLKRSRSAFVSEHVLRRIEHGLLRQEADLDPFGRASLARRRLLDSSHDAQERALARAVLAEDADLGARIEGEIDPLQDLLVGRMDLAEIDHREDVLGRHGAADLSGFGG
jgi:hypothetical protein